MASTTGVAFEITELRLGLPGNSAGRAEKKRVFNEISDNTNKDDNMHCKTEESRAAVVGWPPVCSYRRKNSVGEKDFEPSKAYVKVRMDGVPFLRKVDVSGHGEYADLVATLEKLFGQLSIGDAIKGYDNAEYVPIYEDEDGDWILLGDVPWKMFVESCKRLRIMKKSEAKGFGLQSKKHKGLSPHV